MAYKPTNPLRDYLIGKFPGGATLYLAGKEAVANRKAQRIKISITTITGNTYPLEPGQAITFREFDGIGEEWDFMFQSINLPLRQAFVEEYYPTKKAVKSEPTPDQYYIIKNRRGYYVVIDRKVWDTIEHGSYEPGVIELWDPTAKAPGPGVNQCGQNKSAWSTFKFPQLSSEIKRELQQLNPVRYQEWEDFYVKKYPNMQRIKSDPVFSLEGTDLKDWLFGTKARGWYTFMKHKDKPEVWKSVTYNKIVLHEESLHTTLYPWDDTRNDISRSYITDYQPQIAKQFKRYYHELKQESTPKVEHYNMSGKTPDMFYLYTVGLGWEMARREAIDGTIGKPAPRSQVILISIKDYSIREVNHEYITQFNGHKFEDLSSEQRKTFQAQNPQLFGDWVHHQVGSDLDIDEKAIKVEYKKQLLAYGYGMSPDKIRGKQADMIFFEEAAPFNYVAGIDPAWKPGYLDHDSGVWIETEPVEIGIDYETRGYNGIGRSFTPKWFERHYKMTPAEYYKQYMQEPNVDEEVQKVAQYYGTQVKEEKSDQDQRDLLTKLIQETPFKVKGAEHIYRNGINSGFIKPEDGSFIKDPTAVAREHVDLICNNNQPKYSPNLKTNNTMNFKQLLPNFEFGKVTTDKLALSFAGVAFKAQDGSYKTFDIKTKQLIDCGDLKFDVDFFKMPVQKLKAGDITELDGAYYIVEKVNEDGSFSGIVPTTGTRSNKLARNNIFGFYFYTKIVSLFDMAGLNGGGAPSNNPFGQMNPMMLMMLSDKDSKSGGMEGMMEIMLMSQMFGGGQGFNPFGSQQPIAAEPEQRSAAPRKSRAKTAAGKAKAKAAGLDSKE